ncbi:MAG: hypothetical protein HYW07_00890 [Candidatus Latescibacteria bacterium]|nr:hypothetical protein [Candidatus Latescibacterota bacterium]
MTLVESMKAFEDDTRWIGNHYQELREKYPDEWVAVRNGVVVEHSRELSALMETLKKRCPEEYRQIPVEYLSAEEVHLILKA